MKTTEIYRKTIRAAKALAACAALSVVIAAPSVQAALTVPPGDSDPIVAAINSQLVSLNGGTTYPNNLPVGITTAPPKALSQAVLAITTPANAADVIEVVAYIRGNAANKIVKDLIVAQFTGTNQHLISGIGAAAIDNAPRYASAIANTVANVTPSGHFSEVPEVISDLVTVNPSVAGAAASGAIKRLATNPGITEVPNIITNLLALPADVLPAALADAGKGGRNLDTARFTAIAAAIEAGSGDDLVNVLSFQAGARTNANGATVLGGLTAGLVAANLDQAVDTFEDVKLAGASNAVATVGANIGLLYDRVAAVVGGAYAAAGRAGQIVAAHIAPATASDASEIVASISAGIPKQAPKVVLAAVQNRSGSEAGALLTAGIANAGFETIKIVQEVVKKATALTAAEQTAALVAAATGVPSQAAKIGYGLGKGFSGSAASDPAVTARYAAVSAVTGSSWTAELAAGVIAARKTMQSAAAATALVTAGSNVTEGQAGADIALAIVKDLDKDPAEAIKSLISPTDSLKLNKGRAALFVILKDKEAIATLSSAIRQASNGATFDSSTAAALAAYAKDLYPKRAANITQAVEVISQVIPISGTVDSGAVVDIVFNRVRTFANQKLAGDIVAAATQGLWKWAGQIAFAAAKASPSQAGKIVAAAIANADLANYELAGDLDWGGVAYDTAMGTDPFRTSTDVDQAVSSASIVGSMVAGVLESAIAGTTTAAFTKKGNFIRSAVGAAVKQALAEHAVKTLSGDPVKVGDELQQVRGAAAGALMALDLGHSLTSATLFGGQSIVYRIAQAAAKAGKIFALDIAHGMGEVLGSLGFSGTYASQVINGIFAASPGVTLAQITTAFNDGVTYGAANSSTVGTLAWLATKKGPLGVTNFPVTDISGGTALP